MKVLNVITLIFFLVPFFAKNCLGEENTSQNNKAVSYYMVGCRQGYDGRYYDLTTGPGKDGCFVKGKLTFWLDFASSEYGCDRDSIEIFLFQRMMKTTYI